MKVIAVNGSPRKNWNTHILLEKALEGSASKGAETELVHLYDLTFKGCVSCFECKRKNGPSRGRCALKDDLTPILDRIAASDALILGSPIYFSEVTSSMRALLERLLFQHLSYDVEMTPSLNRIQTAFIYTMNMPDSEVRKFGYLEKFKAYEGLLNILGPCRTLTSIETLQVEDYDKYHMSRFDADQRKTRRREVFPLDCEKAFLLGETILESSH